MIAALLVTFILSAVSHTINVKFDISSPTRELLEYHYCPHSGNMDDFLPIAAQKLLDFGPDHWENTDQDTEDFLHVMTQEVINSDYWSHTGQEKTNFLREVAKPILTEHFGWNVESIRDKMFGSTIYDKNFEIIATTANMVFGTTTSISHTLEYIVEYANGRLLLSAILLQDDKMIVIGKYKFYGPSNGPRIRGGRGRLLRTVTFYTNIIERDINLVNVPIMCKDDLGGIGSGIFVLHPHNTIEFEFKFDDNYYSVLDLLLYFVR